MTRSETEGFDDGDIFWTTSIAVRQSSFPSGFLLKGVSMEWPKMAHIRCLTTGPRIFFLKLFSPAVSSACQIGSWFCKKKDLCPLKWGNRLYSKNLSVEQCVAGKLSARCPRLRPNPANPHCHPKPWALLSLWRVYTWSGVWICIELLHDILWLLSVLWLCILEICKL